MKIKLTNNTHTTNFQKTQPENLTRTKFQNVTLGWVDKATILSEKDFIKFLNKKSLVKG